MRFDIVKLHYLSPQRVISTSSLVDAIVQLIDKIVDVPVVVQKHVPRSWTSVVMLTGASDLGVQTVTASQVQYIVKLFVIPARTFQRRYNAKHQPSRQYRGLWMFLSSSVFDRVVNVLFTLTEERSIALIGCSSCVSKEHCGRPCCVATTRAYDLEGQKTVDVPQVQYTQVPDLDAADKNQSRKNCLYCECIVKIEVLRECARCGRFCMKRFQLDVITCGPWSRTSDTGDCATPLLKVLRRNVSNALLSNNCFTCACDDIVSVMECCPRLTHCVWACLQKNELLHRTVMNCRKA